MTESRYWNPRHETMPREQLDALQVRKLKRLVEWTGTQVPHHSKRLKDAGVSPSRSTASTTSAASPS